MQPPGSKQDNGPQAAVGHSFNETCFQQHQPGASMCAGFLTACEKCPKRFNVVHNIISPDKRLPLALSKIPDTGGQKRRGRLPTACSLHMSAALYNLPCRNGFLGGISAPSPETFTELFVQSSCGIAFERLLLHVISGERGPIWGHIQFATKHHGQQLGRKTLAYDSPVRPQRPRPDPHPPSDRGPSSSPP